jgi:hypothetical protein
MDPKIWSELPYDMVREILGYVDDIDVRLAFDIKPRRNRLPMFDLKIQPLIWGEYWVDEQGSYDREGDILRPRHEQDARI